MSSSLESSSALDHTGSLAPTEPARRARLLADAATASHRLSGLFRVEKLAEATTETATTTAAKEVTGRAAEAASVLQA